MQWLIRGGRVLDPGRLDVVADVLVQDGKIQDIFIEGSPMSGHSAFATDRPTIFAGGKIVVPGLIDMHVHLREPGHEYKETIQTGSAAAARGGFTTVCAMPNTFPVNDHRQICEFILQQAGQVNSVRVYPVAAISKGLRGEVLCDYRELKNAGAIALSDDGRPVMNSRVMRQAMETANEIGLRVIAHCEDIHLAADGAMNEGPTAKRMGVLGIPNAAESIMVQRDIALSELTGVPIHIAHVSTRESVRAIREAKQRGVPVTAETAPHYFTLTEEAVEIYGTRAKMNPPLRSEKDRQSVIEGLVDGTIDAIATDHAPHSTSEKNVPFALAPHGIVGLETSLPVSLKLVEDGTLSLEALIFKMSVNPAKILGLKSGLHVGYPADITVIDPHCVHTLRADHFRSKSRNTPFDGWPVKGRAIVTMVEGRIVYQMDREHTDR